ncbi:MAG: oligosaccharide flippase family protein [Ignavibacteria bacterium]|nr:oligosaccharide flippase family protein [Ignavibacteria bacterium]
MSLKRLAKESLVYGLSGYISKSISLFLLPLYTAVLTPEDYGILELLGTIVVISAFLVVSGTDTSLGYYYFRKEHFNERNVIIISALYLRLIFSVTVFFILFLISDHLSLLIFGKDLSILIVITGLSIIFQTLHSFLFDLLRLEFRVWLYTLLSSLSVLINILLTIYFVLILRQGVSGAVTAAAIAYGIVFIFTLIYTFKRYGFRFSPGWIKNIFSYGFPLIGSGVAYWILNSTDRYFLAHFADLSAVGIYAVGSKLASIVGIVGGALQMAWGPYAMGIQYEENAKQIYAKVFQIYFIYNIILTFMISMFSLDILKVFTQPEYYSARAVVPFLCASTVLVSAYFIVSIGMGITKKVQHTVWITLTAAALNIIMNYLLTPMFGPVGASFSIMTANFLIFYLTYLMSQRFYPIDYKITLIAILLIPAIVIIALTYYLNLPLELKIIVSSLYLSASSLIVYSNFRNSAEFQKIIKLLTKAKSSEP